MVVDIVKENVSKRFQLCAFQRVRQMKKFFVDSTNGRIHEDVKALYIRERCQYKETVNSNSNQLYGLVKEDVQVTKMRTICQIMNANCSSKLIV